MPVIEPTQATATPFFPMADQAAPATAKPATAISSAAPETVTVTASRDGTDDTGKTFFDNLLDVVNPLEHLPIVSTIYSHLTGDKPNDFTQVAGDALYGGPMGLLSSIGNIVFTHVTGKSIGDTVWSMVTGDGKSDAAASTKRHDDVRTPQSPSSDLFSFLRSNVGSEYDSTDVASRSTTPAKATTPSAAARVATTAPTAAPVAAVTAAAAQPNPSAPAAAATTGSTATTSPRVLNPLPARGAMPMHAAPSENVRAAGMASMIAQKAHLKTPMSEAGTPAIQPAAPVATPAPSQQVAQQTSQPPATVSTGADGIPTLNANGEQALLDALNKNGISGALGQRALMAYQKTMAMTPDPSNAAALTSALTLH
jgi:hypothetical protein